MAALANELAQWAHEYQPDDDDAALAERSLLDTMAVILAARGEPLCEVSSSLPDAGRWAAIAHVLDFDDLHLESTTHISAVCVPAVLACGGDAGAYLAAAGVMARIGIALGWPHYSAGWHATCTAGAPAAAVAAAVAMGLTVPQTTTAIALSIPAAGGVQRAFGSMGKALQVGFAVSAGVRAARLAANGADADPTAVDQWLRLVGGDPARLNLAGPAVPGGLAIKAFPCCYAMQRPISAVGRLAAAGLDANRVRRVRLTTPECSVQPLIHHRPTTGLQGKFSLEYAIATALLDVHPGFGSFTNQAVARAEATRLVEVLDVRLTPGGDELLAGDVDIEIDLDDGSTQRTKLASPPGSPGHPLSDEDLRHKLLACGPDVPELLAAVDWGTGNAILARALDRDAQARPAAIQQVLPG